MRLGGDPAEVLQRTDEPQETRACPAPGRQIHGPSSAGVVNGLQGSRWCEAAVVQEGESTLTKLQWFGAHDMGTIGCTLLGMNVVALVAQQGGDPQAALEQAIRAGDSRALDMALGRGAKANPRFDSHESPLGIALQADRRDLALRLLRAGAKVTDLYPGDWASLSRAVRKGDRVLLKSLLEAHPGVPISDGGMEAVIGAVAALTGDIPMLRALQEVQRRPSPPNALHPLRLAAGWGKVEVLHWWCALPEDRRNRDQGAAGEALWDAARWNQLKGLQVLLDAGVRHQGPLPLDACAAQLLREGQVEAFRMLATREPLLSVSQGAASHPLLDQWVVNLSQGGSSGNGIGRAWPSGAFTWKEVKVLLDMGARPGEMTLDLLVEAVRKGNLAPDSLRPFFRRHGPWLGGTRTPPQAPIPRFWPVLRDARLVAILAHEQRALLRYVDDQGRGIPHYLAKASGDPATAEELLNILRRSGVSLDRVDSAGFPPMAYASSPERAGALLRAGASPVWGKDGGSNLLAHWLGEDPMPGDWQRPFWHERLDPGSPSCRALLARPQMRSLLNRPSGRDRRTPLTMRATTIPPLHPGPVGCSPIDVARGEAEVKQIAAGEHALKCHQRDPVTELLLQAGADPRAKDGQGRYPVVVATEAGNLPMLRTLVAKSNEALGPQRAVVLEALEAKSEFTREELEDLLTQVGLWPKAGS